MFVDRFLTLELKQLKGFHILKRYLAMIALPVRNYCTTLSSRMFISI
jgi:hypothetical protein